ncbi:hypothetical protein GCM10029964_089440 [Kibdelosporangium lantanae]
MVATHAMARGLDVDMADLSFDDVESGLSSDTKVAVFSLYIDDFSRGLEVAAQLKRARPDIVTFVGGPHVTMVGDDIPGMADSFDHVAIGDCLPEAMALIEDACFSRALPDRSTIRASSFDARMDHLMPDYSIWSRDRYFPLYPVEFSRGCRQRCPFCTDPVLRRGLAVNPVTKTLRTLENLVATDDVAYVRFVDSSLTSLGHELDTLLDAMIAANLPVSWSAYAYPHDITPYVAQRLAAAGCRAVFMGIETMAQGVRTGKHHTKRPNEIACSVRALQDQGIFVHGNFIIGLPGETAETVKQTLDGLDAVRFDSVGGGPFYLAPGSTFTQRPERFGIEVLDPYWMRRAHENFYHPVPYFRTSTLTQLEMANLTVDFRTQIQRSGLACWNLSDFVVLCWLSVGGDIATLKRLWVTPPADLARDRLAIVDVLRERNSGDSLTRQRARNFVSSVQTVAAAERVRSHSPNQSHERPMEPRSDH